MRANGANDSINMTLAHTWKQRQCNLPTADVLSDREVFVVDISVCRELVNGRIMNACLDAGFFHARHEGRPQFGRFEQDRENVGRAIIQGMVLERK